ncbi:winged helix-turn-helix domain-containing protein [Fibrella aquatica]|uniref:winged helix-turn-helix domain-containing protein n=1 Tax=Fibrella aquatica TaxID=3242487 RepID=UPI0035222F5B
MLRPLISRSPLVTRLLAGSGLLLLLCLLFVRFVADVPGQLATAGNRSDKINLALRRTADRLLRAAGDSISRIPAVQQPGPNTFRIALGHAFDYDKLPGLLRESLNVHQIAGTYDVAVLDCETGSLQLGYSASDLFGKENQGVACGGRSMVAGCYMLQVTFVAGASAEKKTPVWPFLAIGGVLVGVLVMGLRRSGQVRSVDVLPVADIPQATVPTNRLQFGQSCFDVDNQTLTVGGDLHNLTYREAKLLRLLVNRPNQVLERDLILKLVWEDEGVTVGRSLDVFISRLRKLLTNDPTIKIAAVHGVGYRLEVHEIAN